MSKQTVLIAGCTGVLGYAVTKHFESLPDWDVVTLSRSKPDYDFESPHIKADLLEPETLAAADFSQITHIFYAALKPDEDLGKEAEENGAMFRNLVTAVEKQSGGFTHVTFLQGGKVYGAHLGVYKTPAKETDSRHFPPNLYFEHEDFVASCGGFTYTALRPDIVIGHSIGSAMNLGNVIGTYGTLCKHHGVAMKFPGTLAAYDVLVNVCDSDLIAAAVEWSFTDSATHDSAINITNGDIFRWNQVWPEIAGFFDLDAAEPQPIEMADAMESNSEIWKEVAQEHGLAEPDLKKLGKWDFGDFIFKVEADAIFDVSKARCLGFDAMHRDSCESILKHLEEMRRKKLIP